jgi:hypothetical protein
MVPAMRSKVSAALLGAVLIFSPPVALALDVAAGDCKSIEEEAARARSKYIQAFTPRTDPVKTFDDATSSCLEFISMFDIGFKFEMPKIGDLDALLRNMAMKLLQRACQAATQQFNRAVNDAVQSVNAPLAGVADVPGFSAGISTGSSGVSIRDDGGSTVRQAADSAVDRVINIFR